MRRTMAIVALASLPALAACSGRPPADNVAAEEVNQLKAVERNMVTDSGNQLRPGGDSIIVAPEPLEKTAPTAPRGERPAPPAKPSPPPVDPHAGHDMGNMSNMSHD